MKPQFKMREVALAIAAITSVVTLAPTASAADKASTKAALESFSLPRYLTNTI
jgi:hypothetical protein